MKKVILLSIILIFLITGMGFAFQNEPDGFRGLNWGDTPTEDMIFLSENILTQNIYYKKNDKLNIGSAGLDSIFYRFNLYSKQFYKVSAIFYGEKNYDILKIICEERFGKPIYISKRKDYYSLRWVGKKAEIQLYFNFKKGDNWYHKGWFIIRSIEICVEKPEDNKQKEVEKAKEDF